MKRLSSYSFVFVLLFLGTISSLANATEIREKFEKTYALRFGGEFILENTNGSVDVEAWDKSEVKLEALKIVKAQSRRDAKEFMKRVKIRVERNRNRIQIKTEYPKRQGDSGFLSWMFGGKKPQVTVRYTLRVPQEVDLDIETVNGAISVRDVEGEIDLHTTNGHIEADALSGTITAATVNGGIEVELEDLARNDEVRLKTVNGSVVAYFPHDLNADMEANTVNGSIRTDYPLKVRGKWGPKRLSGTVGRSGAFIKMETVNGSIKILER